MNNPAPGCQPCPDHPPADDPNHVIPLPPMNSAECLGLQFALQEFRASFVPGNGPIPHPFASEPALKASIYWGLREIDTLRGFQMNLQQIRNTENHVRRIATILLTRGQNLPNAELHQQPFAVQLFCMNLAIFLVRILG